MFTLDNLPETQNSSSDSRQPSVSNNPYAISSISFRGDRPQCATAITLCTWFHGSNCRGLQRQTEKLPSFYLSCPYSVKRIKPNAIMHVSSNDVVKFVHHGSTYAVRTRLPFYIGEKGIFLSSQPRRSFKAIQGTAKAYYQVLFLLNFIVFSLLVTPQPMRKCQMDFSLFS